jgi:nicotinic acid phosphoribosyltransferase
MMNDKKKTPEFTISNAVLKGETADVYFDHTLSILRSENLNPVAVMEFFPGRAGTLCGMEEVKSLLNNVLSEVECEVWALNEGDAMEA